MIYVPGLHEHKHPAKVLITKTLSHATNETQKSSKGKPATKTTIAIKAEFPLGSVVAVTGAILDSEKYEGKLDPPTFLGVVRDSFSYDGTANLDTGWDETLVEVVVAGEYAWGDKSKPNTRLKVMKNGNLVTMRLPAGQLVNTRVSAEEHYDKWFAGIRSGW